ncbi:MAG: CotH kinase family protein [Acidobacteria bacterium]|nr:CotH kinase family protein [Acidobacteriota bacterium]
MILNPQCLRAEVRSEWNLVVPALVLATAFFILSIVPSTASADEAAAFFADGAVHEMRITFANEGWYDTLYNSHANDPQDPYFPASFEADGAVIPLIGVRFKGNSSFGGSNVKKSFKLDFDVYDGDANFFGMIKLNLNNGFRDPTMLREKLFLDFAARFIPAPRVTFVRLLVNGKYWGLYSAVEQVDGRFVDGRFGDDEDGNLFKAQASDEGGEPQREGWSDLTYLGGDPAAYKKYYQLKTNEAADDYTQLIGLTNVLNNSSPASFPKKLEPVLDVREALYALALNNVFVNLDSYNGSAHNYYIYDRDDTGTFVYIPWDTGLSFGRFLMTIARDEDPLQIDPFWLPSLSDPGGQPVAVSRPLMERLWANSTYRNEYLCAIRDLLESGFDKVTMSRRIARLAKVIRADLKADPNKMYSDDQFEQSLTTDIPDEREPIYGLVSFVERRAAALRARLETLAPSCSNRASDLLGVLHINEVMADNVKAMEDPDDPSDYPDWVELYNSGSKAVDLKGLYLSDDLIAPTKHRIGASVVVPPKGFIVLLADNDADEGRRHLGFRLAGDGDTVSIVAADGHTFLDSTGFGQQAPDVARGRSPDGAGPWYLLNPSTPNASNTPSPKSPPVFVAVNHSPAHPAAGQKPTVTATIATERVVKKASLLYRRTKGGSFTTVSLSARGDGEWTASMPAVKIGTKVEYYLTVTDSAGRSATSPADAPSMLYSYTAGSPSPEIWINEVMAENDSTIQDPDGTGFPDWIEIYNPGTDVLAIGGMFLSDDATDPARYRIPADVVVPGRGFVLFWADNDPDQGSTHTNFKLSASGESVLLVDTDGTTVLSSVSYPPLNADTSYGRTTDGGGTWTILTRATPGTSNSGSSGGGDR